MSRDNDSSTDHRRETSSGGSGAEAVAVPQLAGKWFIRLRKREKRPIQGEGPKGPHFRRNDRKLVSHIENGGNIARVCKDDLVVLDIDSQIVADYTTHLPETLEIGTERGRHLWFDCPEGVGSTISMTAPDEAPNNDLGSIRTGWSIALVPPSIHPTGIKYEILENRPIATVSRAALMGVSAAVDQYVDDLDLPDDTADSTAQHRREDAAAALHGGSGAVDDALSMVDHDLRRAELADILRSSNPPHNSRQWFVGFLYSVVGLSDREITDLIMSHAQWDDLDRRITERQVKSVVESANNQRGDR